MSKFPVLFFIVTLLWSTDLLFAQSAEKEVVLHNPQISATLQATGAELTSLFDVQQATEYLWQGDPNYWSGQAPLLFPIIGSLKNDTFIYNNTSYPMRQHGFARNAQFDLVKATRTRALFSLTSNAQTLEIYPFAFELHVGYNLKNRTLTITYEVINRDNKDIYFSIGGHPGFNCPLYPREKRSDYALVFDKKETSSLHLKPGKLRSGKMMPFLDQENTIPVTDTLFSKGALLFSGLQSQKIYLKNQNKTILSLKFKGFPQLGLWSAPTEGAPFVCIEPWFGLTDPVYTNQQIETKEGIVKLPPGKLFSCQYSIRLTAL